MSETLMEQQKIDLDALEAALAKATPGPWKWSINSKRVQVAAVRHAAQVCAVWNTSAHPASAVAHAIVSAHNALPALIAELRELRARVTWQPMDDAPKDGTIVLVARHGCQTPFLAAWLDGPALKEPGWRNVDSNVRFSTPPIGWMRCPCPTHALPLPPAPEVLNA